MPVGTVRGRYELDAPALRTLRDLERQGIRTEAQMKRLGDEMDRLGGADDERRLREYNRNLADVRRTSERTHRDLQEDWVRTTRVVRREVNAQNRAIDGLIGRMELLGSINAQPKVDVDGVTAAIAAVETLQARINSLGRQNATARVRSHTSGFGGGGGGGGRGNLSGGGRGLRSIGIGPLNFGSAGGAAALLGLLPAGRALLGGAGASVLSLGGAALGAGGLGAIGFGGALGGGGLTALAARGMSDQIGEVTKAQEAYTEAVSLHGRRSTQAKTAQDKLNLALEQAPRGTQRLIREYRELGAEWDRLMDKTGARDNLMAAPTNLIPGLRAAAPTAARGAARTTGAVARESRGLGRFIGGARARAGVGAAAGIFDENLPYVRRDLEAIIEMWMNFMRAGRPFFKEWNRDLYLFLDRWRDGSRDIGNTRAEFGELLDHTREWVRLGGSAVNLMRALFNAGGGDQGKSVVVQLTGQLNEWTESVNRNPAAVREWFRDTTNSAIELARAIGRIVEMLDSLGEDLGPLLDSFTQLISLAGDMGLLTPGVGALAYGAYRGARGRGARGGGAGGGGAGGGAPILPVGGLGGLGGAGRAGARTRGDAFRTGFGRGRAQGMGYIGAARRGLGGARNTTGGLGLGSGRGAMAVRGAGRAFLPAAALLAVLDASNSQYGGMDRARAALSGATLGLVPGAPSPDAQAQRGAAQSARTLGELGVRGDPSGAARSRRELLIIERQITDQRARMAGQSDKDRAFTRGVVENLVRERDLRRDIIRDAEARADMRSERRAGRTLDDLGKAYDIRSASQGPERAMRHTVNRALAIQRSMRPAGAKVISEQMLAWAKEQARQNPKLWREYRALRRGVIKDYSNLGRQVAVVNDRIYSSTREAWTDIRRSIVSEAERARQDATTEFTRLQRVAIGGLVDMGFSRGQAKSLISNVERGGGARASANNLATQPFPGQPQSRGGAGVDPIAPGGNPKGDGIGDGHGAKRLGQGVIGGASAVASGVNLMGANSNLMPYAAIGQQMGLRVSSGLRAGSITNSGNRSHHASGSALDLAGPPDAMRRFALYMAQRFGSNLEELIYSPLGWSIKNGQRVPAYAVPDHYDHVHLADVDPGKVGGLAGAIGGALGSLSVNPRLRRGPGAPDAFYNAAVGGRARGLERAVNDRLSEFGGMGLGSMGPGAAPPRQGAYNAQSLAQLWISAGGNPGIAQLMGAIAMAESSGNPGAIGIPTSGGRARGLWQIMWPLHAGRFPGMNPLDPFDNARMAVSIHGSQGLAAWEAYTRGMHSRFMGDGIGYAGAFARGGSFMTNGPAMFLAGEGRGRAREHVNVRPARPKQATARGGSGGFGGGERHLHVHFDGQVNVRSEADLDAIAERVARKVLNAMDGADDGELIDA